MTTLRRFTCDDLLRFNNVNFDVLTETVRDNVVPVWPLRATLPRRPS